MTVITTSCLDRRLLENLHCYSLVLQFLLEELCTIPTKIEHEGIDNNLPDKVGGFVTMITVTSLKRWFLQNLHSDPTLLLGLILTR